MNTVLLMDALRKWPPTSAPHAEFLCVCSSLLLFLLLLSIAVITTCGWHLLVLTSTACSLLLLLWHRFVQMPMSPRGYMPPMSPSQSRTFASYTHGLSEYVDVDEGDGEEDVQEAIDGASDDDDDDGQGYGNEQGISALHGVAAVLSESEAATRSGAAAGGELAGPGGITVQTAGRSPTASSYEGDGREFAGGETEASFVFEVNPARPGSSGSGTIVSAPTMAHLPTEALHSAFLQGPPGAAGLAAASATVLQISTAPVSTAAAGAGGSGNGSGGTMGSPLALGSPPKVRQVVTSYSSSSQRPLDSPPGVSGEALAVHMAELQLGMQRAGSLGLGDGSSLSGARPRSPGLSRGLSVDPGKGSPGGGFSRWGSGSVAIPGLVGGGLGSGSGGVGAGGVPLRVGSPSILEPEVALNQLAEHERQQRAQQVQQQQHLAQEGMHPRMAYMLRQDSMTDLGPGVGDDSMATSPVGSSHGGSPRGSTYDVGVGETDGRGAQNVLPERTNLHLTSHLS